MKAARLLLKVVATVGLLITAGVSIGSGADGIILAGNHPAASASLVATGNAEPGQPLTMEIRFALRNTAELERLLNEQQDPASPNYHKWLKTGEFEGRFGARDSDVKAVADWLTSEGFAVEPAAESYLRFTGNVSQAQRSFAVRIAKYRDGATYANVEDPTIPSQFAGVVGAITGLDNIVRVHPAGLHRITPSPSSSGEVQSETLASNDSATFAGNLSSANAAATNPLAVYGNIQAFGPQDMRTFYDETISSGSDGAGSCIAMVGLSEVSSKALSVFTGHFHLAGISLQQVVVDKKSPGTTRDGYELEAELDVEWSHAIAPGASQKLFVASGEASADPLADVIAAAANDNQCGTISISYSYCGASSAEFTEVLDPIFRKAAAQGQAVFVSSGDNGAAAEDGSCNPIDARGINEMSADPHVTSVGGTQSNPSYDGHGNDLGYSQESAWNSDGGASGGGVSGVFSKPSYQTGPGVPNDSNRDVPDVALIASPSLPGVFLGDAAVVKRPELICCIGGTSLAAPMMAGFVTVLNQQVSERLGAMNPIFYRLAKAQYGSGGANNGFQDITTGNNDLSTPGGYLIGFNAGPAYDQVTGLGSIDFDVFAAAAKGNLPALTTTMAAKPATVDFGSVDATGLSKPQKVVINNTGNELATMGVVSVPSEFTLAKGGDLCSNQTIKPKKFCTIALEFAPSVPQTESGALSVPYNGAAPLMIALSGLGTAVSVAGPASLAFAPVSAGTPGKPKPVTITNLSATATAKLGTADLSGPFTIASDSCSGTTMGPRKHCVIALEFNPPSGTPSNTAMDGNLNFSFTYGSNDGSVTVPLSGTVK
jgi:pseudomonalisin